MNVRTAKKPKRRFDLSYLQQFNLQTYGHDNLYPQNLRLITGASGTAELCLARYAKFVEGFGFESEELSSVVIDGQGTTADALLHAVVEDIARYGGFALHVNYNVLCEVSSVHFIPFENCRLEEADDAGNVAHIVIHPDWTGKTTRSGKRLLVDARHMSRIPVFDPRPEVVAKQIANCGGIDVYNGQVLWCSMAGNAVYPTPIYDSIITEISTDEGLGNVKYRNARESFLVPCMLVTRKGVPHFDADNNELEADPMISEEDLRSFQGDENTGKIMLVELENNEDKPEVMEFPVKNFDKDFTATETSTIERIYAQFHQELFYAMRIGKLGFSGSVMADAYSYYSGEVTNEQRFIERALKRVFLHWHDPSVAALPFNIQPIKFISSETNSLNE